VFNYVPGVLLDCCLSDVVKYVSRDWRLAAWASVTTGSSGVVTLCNSVHECHRL
jgi:hypothetical protein